MTGLGTLRRDQGGRHRLVTSLAEAWVNGLPVDWSTLLPATTAHIDLPTYAFQHRHYWLHNTLTPQGPAQDFWRYRLDWKRVSPAESTGFTGRWLVVTSDVYSTEEAAVQAEALVAALADSGAEIVRMDLPPLDSRQRFAEALRERGAHGDIDGVVSLLSWDERLHPDHPAPSTRGAVGSLTLLQALGDAEIEAPLWCVTRGAVSVGRADRITSPAQATVWGMGRVAALEHPERWGGLVDLPVRPDDEAYRRVPGVLAGDMGEDQVAVRTSGVLVRRLVRAPLAARTTTERWRRPGGTVLVTGADDPAAAETARRLARDGVEHLLLTSSSCTDDAGFSGLVAELADLGASATVTVCDLTDRDAVARLLASVDAEHPLSAVLHVPPTVSSDPLTVADRDAFSHTVTAKATGALHLDELLSEFTPDGQDAPVLVLFSSVAGIWGGVGQGAYAAGTSFLDALAEQRRAEGRAVTSVAWSPWEGSATTQGATGERLRRLGLRPLAPGTALTALSDVLDRGETAVTVADVDWASFAPGFTVARTGPLLAELPEARRALEEQEQERGAAGADGMPLGREIAALTGAEQQWRMLELVREHLAVVLNHPTPEAVDTNRAFRELGFDSLTAVELRNRLKNATGLSLPVTLVFDYPTPQALAEFLLGEVLGEQAATGTVAIPGAAGTE
ncbi:beta-ketoacyl reductase, partial [Streptomyces sp. RY43-2]